MIWSGSTSTPGARSARMPPTEATDTIRVDARVLQRPDVGAVVHLVRRDRMAVAVPREEHHFAAADAAEGERARGLAVRRARRPCAASTSRLASCDRPLPPMIASISSSLSWRRISGRLRQKPFASMPQPNTKRSGMLQADEVGGDRLFGPRLFSTSTAQ